MTLFVALEHSNADVVKLALSLVGAEPGARALARLGLCLDHASWEVRRLAAELLGQDPPAPRPTACSAPGSSASATPWCATRSRRPSAFALLRRPRDPRGRARKRGREAGAEGGERFVRRAGNSSQDGTVLKPEEFRLLRDLFASRAGLQFGPEFRDTMERRLRERLMVRELASFAEYHHYLQFGARAAEEWDEAIDLLTTNETYIFREDRQLRAF